MIRIYGLTKRFPGGKGIFDLTLEVNQGEVFGFLGPNGAGKSTTIRHLMGFMRQDEGKAEIGGMDCWSESDKIQKVTGYLPGEIAMFEGLDGTGFLDLMAGLRGQKDARRDELLERLELDPRVPIRKMSKGMKQKLAIVAAFMHDPEILILDEPTSGLDPLMQRVFVELILEEKKRGKTIFMSSHLFPEIERTADRVGIIRDGRLIAVRSVQELRDEQRKAFVVTLGRKSDIDRLIQAGLNVVPRGETSVEIEIQGDLNPLIRALGDVDVRHLEHREMDLEEVFMHYYERREAKA
jgi:ABC-2 type transport system ATP-binding protein